MYYYDERAHSITFETNDGSYNTWDKWHMIPTAKLSVNPPDVKEEFVEIPGMHGALDYTELLSGQPIYTMRKGKWDFYVLTPQDGVNENYSWANTYSTILDNIHGKHVKIILEDDPEYFYEGRVKISDYKSDKERSTITIDYTLNPYKDRVIAYVDEDWLWNQLFGIDKILYGKFRVNGSKFRTIISSLNQPVQIFTDSNVSMRAYKYQSVDSDVIVGSSILIPAGRHELDSLLWVDPGQTKFRFDGTGEITLYYQKGKSL